MKQIMVLMCGSLDVVGREITEVAAVGGPRATELATIALRGVPLLRINERQCVDMIVSSLDAGRGGWCVTVNLDILRQAVANPQLLGLIHRAPLRVADGMTLVWASRLQGTPLPERVCGSNMIWSLSEAVAQREHSIYLLGGDADVAERAGIVLQRRYPGLKVAGTYAPPLGFEHNPTQIQQIVGRLQAAQPHVVYVALGFPKAERLIHQIRATLPQAWWMGVGISFSFVCGDVRRAPGWMQHAGLEWVHRLIQEPRRLAKRYLLVGPPAALSLLARSAVQGTFGAPRR